MLIPPPGYPSTEFHGNIVGVTVVQGMGDTGVVVEFTPQHDNNTDTQAVRVAVHAQGQGKSLKVFTI